MISAPKAQAKAKVKRRHLEAIKGFTLWLERNPKASHKEIFEAFDMFVDCAQLPDMKLDH